MKSKRLHSPQGIGPGDMRLQDFGSCARVMVTAGMCAVRAGDGNMCGLCFK